MSKRRVEGYSSLWSLFWIDCEKRDGERCRIGGMIDPAGVGDADFDSAVSFIAVLKGI